MMFMGMAPFGAFFAGAVAHRIGAPWTVAIGGVACIAGAIAFGMHLPNIRGPGAGIDPGAGNDGGLAGGRNDEPRIVVR